MTEALSPDELDLRRERRLGTPPQGRQHLAGLVVVVVDRLLAEDHEERLFLLDDLQEQLGDVQRFDRAALSMRIARSAPIARAVRSCCCVSCGADGDDDDLFSAAAFSLMRIASSRAISSKG